MKTKEELNAFSNEYKSLIAKLAKLTGEELEQVTGGIAHGRTYWKTRPFQNNSANVNDESKNSEN